MEERAKHIAELLKVQEILDYNKRGQSITYSITDHRVEEITHVLKEYYCLRN